MAEVIKQAHLLVFIVYFVYTYSSKRRDAEAEISNSVKILAAHLLTTQTFARNRASRRVCFSLVMRLVYTLF